MLLPGRGPSSSLEAPWPPVKQRGRAHEVGARLQRRTARRLGVLELLDGAELPVHQHGVGQPPEMLGRLELGRIGREEQQMHMLRHAQALGAVPPGPIQHEHSLLGGRRSDRGGKGRQFGFEERDAHAGGQMEDRPDRGRVDEANEVAPREPRRSDARRVRRVADRCAPLLEPLLASAARRV
jgi:hypothetical protein